MWLKMKVIYYPITFLVFFGLIGLLVFVVNPYLMYGHFGPPTCQEFAKQWNEISESLKCQVEFEDYQAQYCKNLAINKCTLKYIKSDIYNGVE